MRRLALAFLAAATFALPARAADAPAGAGPAAAPAATKAAATPAAAKPGLVKPATPLRPAPAGKLFETIRKRGVLLVGTSWGIPWAMRDPQGEWQGFEIDMARQLAADLGVGLTVVPVPFRELTDALQSGRVDIVAAGYSITPQRALVVDFSAPYSQSDMELVARKEAAADLSRPEFRLGVQAGTTAEAVAPSRFPNAKVVVYPDPRAMYKALMAGELDGGLAYAPRTTVAVAQSNGALVVASPGTPLPRYVEAFAVRKGEQELLNYLNTWITFWTADGWIAERHRYWFNTLDWTARFAPADAAPGPAPQ